MKPLDSFLILFNFKLKLYMEKRQVPDKFLCSCILIKDRGKREETAQIDVCLEQGWLDSVHLK